MKSIGGYFELELNVLGAYHNEALKLNTGRNALQFLLKNITCSIIYLPFYTCGVVIECLLSLKITFRFYHVSLNLEPEFDYSLLKDDEYFLYTNYFGLKDEFICYLRQKCPKLIIDNSQSFYSMPLLNVPTFYTARKFFGVPDGAYLYADIPEEQYDKLPAGYSFDRFNFLLKRIDLTAEEGYSDFQSSENTICNLPIERMSKLTENMLSSISYESVAEKRVRNFCHLSKALDKFNEFNVNWNGRQVPMVYPFLSYQFDLKRKLLENKIYTPTYWPNVLSSVNKTSVEYFITSNFVFLPIDQRYTIEEMDYIISIMI